MENVVKNDLVLGRIDQKSKNCEKISSICEKLPRFGKNT